MTIDPALLSPMAAVLAAFLIASASLSGAVYTHHRQDRHQRVAAEVTRRESVYAEFVMCASNLLILAYARDDIQLGGDEQRLIGLVNRMRLFAPAAVMKTAEAVLRIIVQISLTPRVDLRQVATTALSKGLEPDPLLKFSRLCRADLDSLYRNAR